MTLVSAGPHGAYFHEQVDGRLIDPHHCTCDREEGPMFCPVDDHRIKYLQEQIADLETSETDNQPIPVGKAMK